MSTLTPGATHHAFTPPGHPVRNVSVAITIVVVLLAAAWAGGLVTPRLSAGVGGAHSVLTGEGTLALQVHNEALVGFEVHDATIVAEGVTTIDATLGVASLKDQPTVPAGETRPLLIRYEVVGCPDVTPRAEWRIEITSRTALSLTRTLTIPAGHEGPTMLCP